MKVESELEAEERDRQNDEIGRIAKELAGYGFYVMGELLPDEDKAIPRTPAEGMPKPSGRG